MSAPPSRWDAKISTPRSSHIRAVAETPIPLASASKWDRVPANKNTLATKRVNFGFDTPGGFFPSSLSNLTSSDQRADVLTDEALDYMLPSEGFEVMRYAAVGTASHKYDAGSLSLIQQFSSALGVEANLSSEEISFFRNALSKDEAMASESKCLKHLYQMRFGGPNSKRVHTSALVDAARQLGYDVVFRHVLGYLMLSTLSLQDRHHGLKLLRRILAKAGPEASTFTANILSAIEPLLIDPDYFVRSEGRDVLCELARNVGLVPLLQAFKDELHHPDDNMRKTSTKAFAIVAMEVGLASVEKFLIVLCHPKVDKELRLSGMRCIQATAQLAGVGVLPFVGSLLKCSLECAEAEDDVLSNSALLTIGSLAEACHPFGFSMFAPHLSRMIQRLVSSRFRAAAACLKCTGLIVRLHDSVVDDIQSTNIVTMSFKLLAHQDIFGQKIALQALSNCVHNAKFLSVLVGDVFVGDLLGLLKNCLSQGAFEADAGTVASIQGMLLKLARCSYSCAQKIVRWCCDCIRALSGKFVVRLLLSLMSVIWRSQVMTSADSDAVFEVLVDLGHHKFSECWRELLDCIKSIRCENIRLIEGAMDLVLGRMSAAGGQELSVSMAILEGCMDSAVVVALSSHVQRAIMNLYEMVDSDDPYIVAHVLRVLDRALEVDGYKCTLPPVKDVVLRLTTVLRNRNDLVQEACSQLLGRIASVLPEIVSVREWMRICFELLDILGCHRKSARRQAVNAFSAIAKAIGPSDIMIALLNNLKVQERNNRLNTTIAIAIVAESCGPFTVLPLLMNEYRVPELNVQNGVLKSLCFLFEYLAQGSSPYVYAVTTLLEDAFTERDVVHRQMAANVFKFMCVASYGHYPEDLALHFLNYCWPNVFEPSAPVLLVVLESIEAASLVLGAGVIGRYCLQGLFHPARKVRDTYWRIYNNLLIGRPEAVALNLDRSAFPPMHPSPIDVVF